MGMRDLLLARFSVPFWDMQCTLAINLYTLSHPHPSPFTLLTASHPHATLSLHHSLNASSPHCITPHCIIPKYSAYIPRKPQKLRHSHLVYTVAPVFHSESQVFDNGMRLTDH